jgi:hypothetical protein
MPKKVLPVMQISIWGGKEGTDIALIGLSHYIFPFT